MLHYPTVPIWSLHPAQFDHRARILSRVETRYIRLPGLVKSTSLELSAIHARLAELLLWPPVTLQNPAPFMRRRLHLKTWTEASPSFTLDKTSTVNVTPVTTASPGTSVSSLCTDLTWSTRLVPPAAPWFKDPPPTKLDTLSKVALVEQPLPLPTSFPSVRNPPFHPSDTTLPLKRTEVYLRRHRETLSRVYHVVPWVASSSSWLWLIDHCNLSVGHYYNANVQVISVAYEDPTVKPVLHSYLLAHVPPPWE